MNVIVDEELLENARRAIGVKTYSAAIMQALQEVVRRDRFSRALEQFQKEAAKGDFFWPGYLEEIRPNAYSVMKKRKASAYERRAPAKTKSRKRASR